MTTRQAAYGCKAVFLLLLVGVKLFAGFRFIVMPFGAHEGVVAQRKSAVKMRVRIPPAPVPPPSGESGAVAQ